MGGVLTHRAALKPAAIYTKWRIRAVDLANDGNLFDCREVEFRATSGGAAISGGTAIASSEFSGSFVAANAFDGNTGTEWASITGQGVNGWIGKDWGVATSVEEVSITTRASDASNNPTVFAVEKFNNTSGLWEVAWYDVMGAYLGGETVVSTRADVKSAWRVRITASSAASTTGYSDVELRATNGGADQTSGGRALCHGNFSGSFPASNAFDGTTSEWVDTNGKRAGAWIGYRWTGSLVTVAEVALTARNSPADNAGTAFSIDQFDFTTGTWTASFTASTPNTWGAREQRVFH
jgi:hypothetical protein